MKRIWNHALRALTLLGASVATAGAGEEGGDDADDERRLKALPQPDHKSGDHRDIPSGQRSNVSESKPRSYKVRLGLPKG